jgi:TonB family protein
MSGTSVLTIALALSTLAHTGLAVALCYAPLVKTDLFSHRRPQPVELEFEVTSEVKADTIDRSIEAPTTSVDSTVRRPKRRYIKKRSPVVAVELRPKPAEEQNPREKPVEDKPIDASLNPDAFQNSATAEPTALTFGQPNANEASVASSASAATSGSARSNAGVSASTQARRAPSRRQWNSIRSAIERYIEYPRLGRRFGWAGKVTLRFKLMADGRVLEARVDKSSGFALLDRSALKALKRAAPLPRPETATEITVPILFALR